MILSIRVIKMKKRIIIICTLGLIVVLIFSFKPLVKIASDSFWNFVDEQLEKEEQERKQKIKNGEIVAGKDTILIWENKYEIGHFFDGNHLVAYRNGSIGLLDTILKKVTNYKVKKEKLYIVSEEGYAIIDKNNLCKIYVIIPENEFISGYTMDAQGNKSYISRYVENENIQYLSSFDEFSKEEQKILNKLKK